MWNVTGRTEGGQAAKRILVRQIYREEPLGSVAIDMAIATSIPAEMINPAQRILASCE